MENGFFYYVWGKWTKQGRIYIGLCLIAFLAVLWAFSSISSCRREKAKQADEKNKSVIEQDKGAIEVLEKDEKKIEEKEKNANENSKKADANFNAILRRPVDTFDGNFGTVRSKFCQQPEFKDDPSCRR